MAASSFRCLLDASNSTPIFSDQYQSHIPVSTWDSGLDPLKLNNAPIAGSSTTWYTVGASDGAGSGLFSLTAYISTSHGSYTTLGSSLALSTTANNSVPGIDSLDSNNFVTAYINSSSTSTIQAQYINNSSGTLTQTVGATTVVSSAGALNYVNVMVLDSGNTLVMGLSNTASRGRISLVNTTTLAAIQSNTATVIATAGNHQTFVLSPTLAVISWSDGVNEQISTIDVVSGSSFTLNAAYNTSSGSALNWIGIKVNSTTALFVYYKSTNTIAARTATIGAGGSVTLNTEYTSTRATNIAANGMYCVSNYGSDYIAFYNVTAGNYQAFGLSLSGNVITFDSNGPVTVVTGNSVKSSGFNAYSGTAIHLDSSHVAITYFNNSSTSMAFNGVVQVNNTTQTWGTFSGLTSGVIALGSGVSTYTNAPNTCWTGSQQLLTSAYVTAGSLGYYSPMLFGGGSATTGALFSPANANPGGTYVGSSCPLGYNTTNNNVRALTVYYEGFGTGDFITQVVRVNGGAQVLFGASATFTGVLGSMPVGSPGFYNLIQIGADTALLLTSFGAAPTTAYSGSIITTSTGLNTISTSPNVTQILTLTGSTFGTGTQFLQYAVISSTSVAIIYQTEITLTSKYSLNMVILTISGATITAGTPQTIVSNYTNPMQSFGISVFTGSSTGIVFYTDDNAPGTVLYANGFTYSGSTITLGSQNTLATSQHIVNKSNGNGNPSMVTVSPTEAICLFYDSTAAQATMRLLTYVNVNSITTGSAIQGGATTTNAYLIAADNYNDTFTLYTDNGYTQYYRG